MTGMKDASDLTPEEAAKRLREIMYAASANRGILNTGPMKRAIRELADRAGEAAPPEPSSGMVVTSHGVGRGALFAGLALLVVVGGIVAAIVVA